MRTASNLTALEHIGSARNAFADLEHWLYSHTSTTHKLHSIEVEQERRGREVLRLMLQAHIDSRGDGCVGDGLVVNPQGSSEEIVYRHKRLRSRRLITVFGPVSIRRMEYSSRGQHSLYPLDAVLGLPARSYSYEIQRRLVKAAVKGPFDEAIEELADALGVNLSKRTAEQIVADASVDFESFYRERSLRLAPDSGPLLIASVDGKGVPMVNAKSDSLGEKSETRNACPPWVRCLPKNRISGHPRRWSRVCLPSPLNLTQPNAITGRSRSGCGPACF